MEGRIIVGITGASGIQYGIRLIEMLQNSPSHEVHGIISEGARIVAGLELEHRYKKRFDEMQAMRSYGIWHNNKNLAACVSSGSFKTIGMVVVPCSIATLSDIVHSRNRNLITRAADVCMKEGRKVVLVVRETPLHKGHLRLLVEAADLGYTVMPPIPSFYNNPISIEDIVNQTIGRILDQFDIDSGLCKRWS